MKNPEKLSKWLRYEAINHSTTEIRSDIIEVDSNDICGGLNKLREELARRGFTFLRAKLISESEPIVRMLKSARRLRRATLKPRGRQYAEIGIKLPIIVVAAIAVTIILIRWLINHYF